MRFTPSESETVRVWTGRLTTNPVTVRLASRGEGKHWPPSQPQSPASRPAIDPAILERDAAQDQATRSAASAAYDKATDALLAGAPRAEAAKQFAAISDTYPQSRWAPLSAELGRLLAEMAEADRQFREPPDPDALPMKERIEYLVFKLRDVAVRELFGPGKCQVLFLKRDHAAWRLRRIGKPAVPALLALLNDRRPTRSSCEPLNGGHVLRYADVALQVLEAIAARTFDHQTLRGSCLTNADEQTREEIVEEVEDWWRRNRDKDEAEWIRESLAAGGVTSMWNRLQWAERLIDLQGPAAADFFRRRLAAEPDNPHIPRLLNEAMAAAAGEPSSRPAALDLQDAARRLTEATGFEWRVARRERAPGLGAELSGGVSTWHGLIVPYFVLPFAPDEGKLALFRQNCNAALDVIAHDQRCTLLAGPAREPAVTAKVLSALGLQQTEEAERLRLAHARAEWMDFRLAVAQPAEGQAGLRTLADGPSDDQIQDYRQLLVAKGPNGGRHRGDPFLWFHPMDFCGLPATLVTAEDRTQVPYILLSDRPQDTMLGRSSRPRPWHLKRVYAASDARGGPAVAIEFDEAAARRMGELTAANIGRPLAVLFSGNVLCVLPIQAKIAGRMLLTGDKLDKPLVDRIVQTLSECMLVEDAAPEKAQGSAPGP
jgi:hypothetical protein